MTEGLDFQRGRLLFSASASGTDIFSHIRSRSEEHSVLERSENYYLPEFEKEQKSKKNEENEA